MPPSPDREAIIDAFFRFFQAVDENNPSLFETALTSNVVLDMSGLSAIFGTPGPVLNGLQEATKGLFELGVAQMDTGHVMGNFRVEMKKGHVAHVSAMAIANHYRKGEGCMPTKAGFMAGNQWTGEVVEAGEEGVWKISKADLKIMWCEGDVSVFEP